MQETPAGNTLTAQHKGQLTFRTIWPQLAAGLICAGTLVIALQNPSPQGLIFVAGAGFLFAFTLIYLYSLQKGRRTATSLLTWIGGVVLALFSALTAPHFLALSALFVFAAVCYGLGASSRRTMLIGTVIAWLALAASFILHLLVMAGVLSIGISNSSLMLQAGLCIVSLLLAADTMQRLWRHYNRNADAVRELQLANEALVRVRTSLEKHLNEQAELLEVSYVIRSTQELEPLLDEILAQLKRVMNYGMATALILRDGQVVATRHMGLRFQEPTLALGGLLATPHWKSMIEQKQPVVVDDIFREPAFLDPFIQTMGSDKKFDERQRSWLGLPLIVRGELVGALSVTASIAGYFDAARIEMAFAFANHAAVAIESSRTRQEAINAAALAERARLARELHDSVSQALYGMVLSTRTSLELIERDPAKARDTMRYTLDLADAALSEMRALIFELRPESLKEEGLLTALRKQATAITARHKLDLQIDLCGEEPALPFQTKEALYRIAMEALQNAVRHAGAGKLHIATTCNGKISLSIEDDGCGFDVNSEHPGHFGLQTMRERAQAVGGDVSITSRADCGTLVQITVPLGEPAKPTAMSAFV